jgi:hypothetical protein
MHLEYVTTCNARAALSFRCLSKALTACGGEIVEASDMLAREEDERQELQSKAKELQSQHGIQLSKPQQWH